MLSPNDSLIWAPVPYGSTTSWQPVSNWGWRTATEAATGWVEYTDIEDLGNCEEDYSGFLYHDPSGGIHPFNGTVRFIIYAPSLGCYQQRQVIPITNAPALDNSGYILATTFTAATVNARGSITIVPPPVGQSTGAGSVTDANGNRISVSSGGVITDTLNTTALTVSGTPPANVTYSYTAPSGAQASVTVSYVQYGVQTCFQVSGIQDYPSHTIPLVDRVTLPDNSFYQFHYEPTVGCGTSGKTTGRIASVTLPTGGVISYSYAGTTCGNNNNCMMADGSPSTMARTLGGGTWNYTRGYQTDSSHPTQTTTTVLDPASPQNETDFKFSGIYQTEKAVYQGPKSTLLDYSYICYDPNAHNNPGCPTATVASPVTWAASADALNNMTYGTTPYSGVWRYYDTYGNLTQELDYDYGTSTHTLLRNEIISYNTPLCSNHNICDHPASVQILDGTSTQKAYTTYTYDNNNNTTGNVTTVSKWISGSSNLNWSYGYNTGSGGGGTLATASDPNGTQTSYTYTSGSCNNAFPTSVTAAGLTTQYQYNCTGGVVTEVTDPNNASVSTSYTDPYFWRPASTTDQLSPGNVTTLSYYPTLSTVGQVESVMNFTVGGVASTTDVFVTPNSLGRPYLTQQREAPQSSTFDTVETDYDSVGHAYHNSLPFAAGLGQANSGAAGTSVLYDGYGRPTTVSDSGGGSASYTYNLNDARVNVAAPTGENPKRRQFERDSLGRLSSVCEITSAGGSGSCGQQTSATGFFTSYTYDPLGNLTNVNQSSQTRTFAYDGLSRMISEAHPESGTTGYTYDTDATCGTSTGNKVKRYDAAHNTTCYAWDGLHRLTQVSYPSGPNTSSMPSKYYVYDSAPLWGITVNNGKGRLTEAYTYLGGSTYSAEAYSYNARGEATDFYEATANGGWYHTQEDYFANGVMKSGGAARLPERPQRFMLEIDHRREELIMQVLENWHPQGVTVYMDDKRFVKCVLTDCKLVYGGGDVTWENTQFVNCQLSFDGAAQRTVAYLQNFGLMKPPVTNATPSAQPNSGVN